MNPNRRKKKKEKKQKKITYITTQHDAEKITQNYILHFNYRYWYHKLNALYGYVSNPEKIKTDIKFDYDTDLDETILENLKLEIHSEVFHSAETLFLVLFGFLFEPKSLPFWISRCSSQQLHGLIKKLAEDGLTGFNSHVTNIDDWLRSVLYPAIDPSHEQFENSKLSTTAIKDYLKRLAQEYIDHAEYNSFKHGLRCSPGQSRYQLRDDGSGEIILDSTSDTIQFLELEKIDQGKQISYRIRESSKTYDVKRDGDIIVATTYVLSNIFNFRQLQIKKELVKSDCKIKFVPYFFKEDGVSKIFQFKPGNSQGGFMTKFSISSN